MRLLNTLGGKFQNVIVPICDMLDGSFLFCTHDPIQTKKNI